MTDDTELPPLDIDELYQEGRDGEDSVWILDSRDGEEKYEFRLRFLRDIMRGNRELTFGDGRVIVGLCKFREPSTDKIFFGIQLSRVLAAEEIEDTSKFIPREESHKIGEPLITMYFPTAEQAVAVANAMCLTGLYTVELLEKSE